MRRLVPLIAALAFLTCRCHRDQIDAVMAVKVFVLGGQKRVHYLFGDSHARTRHPKKRPVAPQNRYNSRTSKVMGWLVTFL
jgi:hypothetical protein